MSRQRTRERLDQVRSIPDATFDKSKLTYPRDKFELVSIEHMDTWKERHYSSCKETGKKYAYMTNKSSVTITVKCKRCGHVQQFLDSPTLTCRFGPCSFTWRDIRKENLDGVKPLEYVKVKPRGKREGWYWKCACADCGDIVYLSLHQIIFDHSKYCKKCAVKHRMDNVRLDPAVCSWNSYYANITKRSEVYGDVCDLSKEEVIEMASKPCYYCGALPIKCKHHKHKLVRNGIDRIDSTRGYIRGNCVPCCSTCNRMKLDMTQSSWIEHMRRILALWDERSTTIPKGSTPKRVETESP